MHQPDKIDDIAEYVMGGPLVWGLAALCLIQLLAWTPHYLTWPMWADHDVFATMARAWDAGQLPYRDQLSNNFPGTVYLFWLLGRSFGWGNSVALYALDVALLVALGVTMLLWSVKRFGALLPGLVGSAAVLSYYLALDFTRTAQRDWHGPLLAVMALLVLQIRASRLARIGSALALAVAVTVRPQAIVFLPALLFAVSDGASQRRDPAGPTPRRAVIAWTVSFAAGVACGFLPLAVAGVLDDFATSVRLLGYGPAAATRSILERTTFLRLPLSNPELVAVPLVMWLLARQGDRSTRSLSVTWIVAFAGSVVYEPLSPAWRSYLVHPLWLVWCGNVALLAGVIQRAAGSTPTLRLTAIVMLLAVSVVPQPKFCMFRASMRTIGVLQADAGSVLGPPGYTHAYNDLPRYAWNDYDATLAYIRTETAPELRVANVLIAAAITGPTGRLSALPAESATWLYIVEPADEDRFVQSLKQSANSIVVWAPDDLRTRPHAAKLAAVIPSLYEPAVTFGSIHIWRRRLVN